jgi:hypothetical protein
MTYGRRKSASTSGSDWRQRKAGRINPGLDDVLEGAEGIQICGIGRRGKIAHLP